MIECTSAEIAEYAKDYAVEYREDSSNQTTNYLRNRVRLELLPLLVDLKPEFEQVMAGNLKNMDDARDLLRYAVEQAEEKHVEKANGRVVIDADAIGDLPVIITHTLLSKYGFNAKSIRQVIEVEESGKVFQSGTHSLLVDRGRWLIAKHDAKQIESYWITEEDLKGSTQKLPVYLKMSMVAEADLSQNSEHAFIDYNKLKFPLLLRTWREGDRFTPLGMNGSKKLSDFYIDEKYSLMQKEEQWLLFSDNKIVWVIGKRIDEHVKINDETRKIAHFVTK